MLLPTILNTLRLALKHISTWQIRDHLREMEFITTSITEKPFDPMIQVFIHWLKRYFRVETELSIGATRNRELWEIFQCTATAKIQAQIRPIYRQLILHPAIARIKTKTAPTGQELENAQKTRTIC